MPLTPAEVHNVAFKKPPIGKRGYDEEEVDAFLDIVEVELSRLIEENSELRGRPGGAPAPSAAEPSAGGDGSAELGAAQEENNRLRAHIAELERALTQGKDQTQAQLVTAQQQLQSAEQQLAETRQQIDAARQEAENQRQQAAALGQQLEQVQAAHNELATQVAQGGGAPATGASSTTDHATQAVQMLALAQQTADQHLAQSRAEAERLVNEARSGADSTLADAKNRSEQQLAEAQARADKLDQESSARATQTVQDAEQRAATITAQLEQRKAALERRLEELRTFEREYRTRLKSYLESQLRDLDASGRAEPANNRAGTEGSYAEAQAHN